MTLEATTQQNLYYVEFQLKNSANYSLVLSKDEYDKLVAYADNKDNRSVVEINCFVVRLCSDKKTAIIEEKSIMRIYGRIIDVRLYPETIVIDNEANLDKVSKRAGFGVVDVLDNCKKV